MTETKVILKLMIDSKTNKVLFAEAGKEFVDFLFHIMSLPVGIVVKLLKVDDMVGSLGVLYKSIESLRSDFFQDNIDKDFVLQPKVAVKVPLLELNEGSTCNKIYRCLYHTNYVSHDFNAICPCGERISTTVTYVHPKNIMDAATTSSGNGGYVKGLVTYVVMDNLEVKPMSTISGIALMNKFHVKDVSSLIEKEVHVGLREGLAILKASFEVANTVLTTVFLSKKAYYDETIIPAFSSFSGV